MNLHRSRTRCENLRLFAFRKTNALLYDQARFTVDRIALICVLGFLKISGVCRAFILTAVATEDVPTFMDHCIIHQGKNLTVCVITENTHGALDARSQLKAKSSDDESLYVDTGAVGGKVPMRVANLAILLACGRKKLSIQQTLAVATSSPTPRATSSSHEAFT